MKTKTSKLTQTSHYPLWRNAIVSRYRHKYGNVVAIIIALRLSLAGIVANEMDDINIPPNIIPSDDDGRPEFIKQRMISSEKRRPGWTAVGQMTRTNWLPDASLFIPSVAPSFCLFAHVPWPTRGEAGFHNERITADSQCASIINKSVPELSRCPLETLRVEL